MGIILVTGILPGQRLKQNTAPGLVAPTCHPSWNCANFFIITRTIKLWRSGGKKLYKMTKSNMKFSKSLQYCKKRPCSHRTKQAIISFSQTRQPVELLPQRANIYNSLWIECECTYTRETLDVLRRHLGSLTIWISVISLWLLYWHYSSRVQRRE